MLFYLLKQWHNIPLTLVIFMALKLTVNSLMNFEGMLKILQMSFGMRDFEKPSRKTFSALLNLDFFLNNNDKISQSTVHIFP